MIEFYKEDDKKNPTSTASDMWSLGVLYFYMLYGFIPFGHRKKFEISIKGAFSMPLVSYGDSDGMILFSISLNISDKTNKLSIRWSNKINDVLSSEEDLIYVVPDKDQWHKIKKHIVYNQ